MIIIFPILEYVTTFSLKLCKCMRFHSFYYYYTNKNTANISKYTSFQFTIIISYILIRLKGKIYFLFYLTFKINVRATLICVNVLVVYEILSDIN